jgi:hypothetical protein
MIMGCAVPNAIKIGAQLQAYVHSLYLGAHHSPLYTVLFSELTSLEICAEQVLVTVLPRIAGETTLKSVQRNPSGTIRSRMI